MTIGLPGVLSQYPAARKYTNYSVSAQAPVAATRTLIAGTDIEIPQAGLKVGAKYKMKLAMTKTAAGTATSTFDVAIVQAGNTLAIANAVAINSFTKPAGTAAADEAVVEIEVTITAISDTVGTAMGEFELRHNLAATGHAQIPVVVVNSAGTALDTKVEASAYIVACITTGAADAITISSASAELVLPA